MTSNGLFTSSLLLDYEEFVVLKLKDGTRDLSSMIVFLPKSASLDWVLCIRALGFKQVKRRQV